MMEVVYDEREGSYVVTVDGGSTILAQGFPTEESAWEWVENKYLADDDIG